MKLEVVINGTQYQVDLSGPGEAQGTETHPAFLQSAVMPAADTEGLNGEGSAMVCRSPLSGIVTLVLVHPGDELRAHDLMLVLEAMKMETKLTAPRAGKLKSVNVSAGAAVRRNQVLVEFE
jgi:methylmalonyl-CoA carboxyltransferase small subunit